MSKIQEALLDVYEDEISEIVINEIYNSDIDVHSISEEELDEIVGTALGFLAGKAIAPAIAGLGAKLTGLATGSKIATLAGLGVKGATLAKGAVASPYVGGALGLSADLAVGKALAPDAKKLKNKIVDKVKALAGQKKFKVYISPDSRKMISSSKSTTVVAKDEKDAKRIIAKRFDVSDDLIKISPSED